MSAVRRPEGLRLAGLVLAVLGLGIAGYLTYVHYSGATPVCEISHGCEKVQTSDWSKLAGVPVALLGLIGYVGILGALLVPGENGAIAAAAMSWIGFGFSAYLTYREIFTIEAICIWCVGSAIVLTLLTGVTTALLLRGPAEASRSSRRRAPRAQRRVLPYVAWRGRRRASTSTTSSTRSSPAAPPRRA